MKKKFFYFLTFIILSMSQISDIGTFKQREQTSQESLFERILGDVSTTVPDGLFNFVKKNQLLRSRYKFMSPYEQFVSNVKNNPELVRKNEITNQEIEFILLNCAKIPNIQFKNFLGFIYAYRYFNLVSDFYNQYNSQEKLLNLIAQANENSVPTFDIIRYYKLMNSYHILGDLNNPTKIMI
jgi:hypothetical protein